MSKISIAFGITFDWLRYSCVTICSILSHAKSEDDYKFYLMSDKNGYEFFKEFEKYNQKLKNIHDFDYEYIQMDNSDFDGIVHDKRVGISAYYRLKLPSLVKENKILYLDSDIIVLDNISRLWETDITDFYIGAVEDKYSALMGCRVDFEQEDTYINSGVLLMNLEKFRQNGLEEKIFQKLNENNNDYSDQDVLNYVCKDKILFLPLKYNLMLSADDENSFPKRRVEYNDSLKKPFLIHYSIKPWILPVQYSEYWRAYDMF